MRYGKAKLYYDIHPQSAGLLDAVARRIKYFPRVGFGDIPTTQDIAITSFAFSYPPVSEQAKNFLTRMISESRPPIVLWEVKPPFGWHYVVVIGYDSRTDSFLIADPWGIYYWLPWHWPGNNKIKITAHDGGVRDSHSFYRMWGHHIDVGEEALSWIPTNALITFGTGIYATDIGKYLAVVPDIGPKYHHLESETFRIRESGNLGLNLFDYDEFKIKRKVEGKIVKAGATHFGTHKKNTAIKIGDNDNELIVTTELKDGWLPVEYDADKILRNGTIFALPYRALNFIIQGTYTGFIDMHATVYYEPGSSVPTAPPLRPPAPLAQTALLPNYPNPFNPETWIPYQLAKPSEVTLYIHGIDGKLVRKLALGHQAAGVYRSKARAAYWDGRNAQGERVASGLYFYTLITDDFRATGKMLIMK